MIHGSRLYGKTDEVPGVCWVATKFGHLNFFPLFPCGSWIVVREEGRKWWGKEIPLSLKSMFLAWVRAFSFLGGLVGVVLVLAVMGERGHHIGQLLVPAVVSAGSLAVFALTYLPPLRRASAGRTLVLLNTLGIAMTGVCMKCGVRLPRNVTRHCPECGATIARAPAADHGTVASR